MKRRTIILMAIAMVFATILTGCGKVENYKEAISLYENGQYEEAKAIFKDLGDYEKSEEYLVDCEKGLMHQTYADVFSALKSDTWYYNGGSYTKLNSISFTDEEATIAQVYYDGNGKHENGSNSYSYVVGADDITITMADESELKISYVISDGAITLGSDEYYTIEEVDAGLQGYWKSQNSYYNELTRGINCSECNIYINSGKFTSEKAATAYSITSGEYFYYGPFEGSYTLNFGSFDTDVNSGTLWFFNIIDGEVTLFNYYHVCIRSDKLPGENGYSF